MTAGADAGGFVSPQPGSQRPASRRLEPGSVRIGTSGWQYRHWRGVFYPEDLPQSDWLAYFQARFDTVEINNSFYRLPSAETFAKWRSAAPPGFLYAVKASRYLTHMKRLKDPEEPLARFLGNARELGDTLGPVLYQLPPRFRHNQERLEHFLDILPDGVDHVMEFRDPTWHTEEVYRALAAHGVALCLHDATAAPAPVRLTAPFTYVRFHGPGKDYEGDYPRHRLAEWAERISDWRGDRITTFAYFNNDPEGWAIANAHELRELVG